MRSPSHPITIFYCVLTILLVKRRRKELGLHGSKTTMKTIDLSEAEQLDGHDKLYKIGFPIWAIVDDATSKWLGAWVVPSNRMGNVIAYLWLCAVQKYGGKRIFVLLLVVVFLSES